MTSSSGFRRGTRRSSASGARSCPGGERQRICVARAFIKDAPILILDEPTSSIDSKTEAVILDSLERLMAGRTSFMIAHRLSTIRHADKIVVIDRGRRRRAGNARGVARARRPLPAAVRGADAPTAALLPRRRRPSAVGAGEAAEDARPPEDRRARDDDQDPGGGGRLADASITWSASSGSASTRTTSRRTRGRRGC